jgi:hypothetical protein
MTCSKVCAILIAIALLAGCGTANSPAASLASGASLSKAPSTPAVGAIVRYCADGCSSTTDTLAIDSVRDVNVSVSWSNLEGIHTQQLRFRLPSGDEYQKLNTEFDTSKLPLVGGSPTVQAVLPVAGTWIQQHATVGAWTVDVYLDDKLITSSTLHFQ